MSEDLMTELFRNIIVFSVLTGFAYLIIVTNKPLDRKKQ